MDDKIIVYGTQWCGDCHRTRAFLDSKNIPYSFVNIDDDEKAIDTVLKLTSGRNIIPTVVLPGGETLLEPSNDELENAIAKDTRLRVLHKLDKK